MEASEKPPGLHQLINSYGKSQSRCSPEEKGRMSGDKKPFEIRSGETTTLDLDNAN